MPGGGARSAQTQKPTVKELSKGGNGCDETLTWWVTDYLNPPKTDQETGEARARARRARASSRWPTCPSNAPPFWPRADRGAGAGGRACRCGGSARSCRAMSAAMSGRIDDRRRFGGFSAIEVERRTAARSLALTRSRARSCRARFVRDAAGRIAADRQAELADAARAAGTARLRTSGSTREGLALDGRGGFYVSSELCLARAALCHSLIGAPDDLADPADFAAWEINGGLEALAIERGRRALHDAGGDAARGRRRSRSTASATGSGTSPC